MALSNPRLIFGVHTFTPYSRTTGLPYGMVRVLGSSSLSLSGELIKLEAGSYKYAWGIEEGVISAELSLTVKEYPDFLFELFLGKGPTSNAAEAAGSVTTIENKYGTSVVASTGIASVGLKSGSSSSVKFGWYVVKAASATTVNVYAASNIDFLTGTDLTFQDDDLKITASALTIATSTAVEIPGTGLELTGGAGTIGMTENDTAIFQSRPINTGSMDVTIGGTSDTFPEFGAIVLAQKRGNAQMFEVDVLKCKAVGLPIGFNEKEWSTAEITAEAYYDSTEDAVLKIRQVDASA